VLFNATRLPQSFTVAHLAGRRFQLHPVQRSSHDPVVRTASYDRATGTFSVPARTAAVFWAMRPLLHQVGRAEEGN
jgi:pullulanase